MKLNLKFKKPITLDIKPLSDNDSNLRNEGELKRRKVMRHNA